jgi:hypothetical protein
MLTNNAYLGHCMNHLSQHARQACVFIVFFATVAAGHAAQSNPDEIVSRHLNSIAPQSTRAAVKSRVVQGRLRFRVLIGGAGGATGAWDIVSAGRKMNVVMQFGMGDWLGEQFIYDGSKVGISTATASHLRSEFGQFVASEDFIMKEGLLGGELTTAWALQDLATNNARLENLGLKKIHGKQLFALQYFSKHSGDMQVKLYFDPETYHHVMTVYVREHTAAGTGDIRTSSAQKQPRYTLEEHFDDFQAINGITLPHHYGLQWTEEFQDGLTRVLDWDCTASHIRDDLPLDPANFQVK